ncbi:hypothetical protein KOR42_05630 [Thalassoglobus neptunius]|uniref:Uncharacterized protein n=1 Tax=Thalassoglobus neptunius TaxID=1938619 RepID=A0A5C5X4T3_9PLAN|nr:hypothetical protein [Thalassoglobus neptunius]TWT57205.1 hypothetical protein KOR42_05630 [Thalassoglobus neptunius]
MSTATKDAASVINEQESHLESIEHGKPERLSEAATEKDYFPQGDVYFGVVNSKPTGYEPGKPVSQLAVGNTQGQRHCLDCVEGVEMYFPGGVKNWQRGRSGLLGPVFRCPTRDVTVVHPTHGDLTIPKGMMIQTVYQRNWDEQLKAEARARD